MAVSYGYYLPLSEQVFDEIRFLGITPKTSGMGDDKTQATDTDGTPKWVVSALVKYDGGRQETEIFTLIATAETAAKINTIEELTPIKLLGLSGGKWSRAATDKTTWSFQITGIQAVK